MAVASRDAEGKPVVCLMGPTASGKTRLAVALVQHLPVAIISVDSAMIYRGMDIGTGKPEPALLELAPHRLIDIRDPDQPYSAAEFIADAVREIEAVHEEGRVPLLVGGTGLYFRALREGLACLPPADPRIRASLAAEADAHGWKHLHARLAEVDPESAARIHPNDPQRIQRALEVLQTTGRPMSALLSRGTTSSLSYPLHTIIIEPRDRARLHGDIAERFHDMLAAGLVEEVTGLRARWRLTADLPSMRAVGYRQVSEYLDAGCDYRTMVERGITATRQLARRQLTWLRSERGAIRFDCHDTGLLDELSERMAAVLEARNRFP